jgi:hypothetical protein
MAPFAECFVCGSMKSWATGLVRGRARSPQSVLAACTPITHTTDSVRITFFRVLFTIFFRSSAFFSVFFFLLSFLSAVYTPITHMTDSVRIVGFFFVSSRFATSDSLSMSSHISQPNCTPPLTLLSLSFSLSNILSTAVAAGADAEAVLVPSPSSRLRRRLDRFVARAKPTLTAEARAERRKRRLLMRG